MSITAFRFYFLKEARVIVKSNFKLLIVDFARRGESLYLEVVDDGFLNILYWLWHITYKLSSNIYVKY